MVRLVAAGIALIAVTYGLARFALGLFVPELRGSLGLSATAVGVVLGASFAGYVGGLLVAGVLVPRHGGRAVAVASGLVAASGMAGVAAASGPVTLGLAAAVAGTSTGLASPALAALVEERVATSMRAGAQAVVNAGTSVGLVAAVPVAALAAAAWRGAWVAFASAAILASVGLAAAVPPGHASSPSRPLVRLSPMLQASALLLGLSSAAFWGFGRELLEVTASLPPTVSRLAWVAAGVVGTAGALAGTAARRVGLPVAVAASGAALALSLGVLAAAPRAVPAALAAAGLFGASYMAMTGLLIVWSVQEQPGGPAAAVATAFLVLAVGQAGGSLLAGRIADHIGLGTTFATAAVLAVATCFVLPLRPAVPAETGAAP